MKVYKKLATLAPIAAISTSVLFSPAITLAASPTNLTKASPAIPITVSSAKVDINTIKKDLEDRYVVLLTKGTSSQLAKTMAKGIAMALFHDWTPTFENGNTGISLGNVRVDHYTDDNIELATYTNTTSKPQTFQTPSTKKTVTDSFTYTNAEGVKLGVSSETKLGVKIPFVAEGGETITVSTEFTYNHTSSNTTTNSTEITYPSQTIICDPGYKVSLLIKTSKATFSGNIEASKKITNAPAINNKPIDLYNLYKDTSNNIPIPSYVTLDDNNYTATYGKINIPYTGVAGHLSDAKATQVKIESLDKSKKPVIMSLREYQIPKVRADILKQH